MPPSLPQIDYSLVTDWMTQVLERFWVVVAVFLGVLVGTWVFRAFRRAVERD